MSTAIKPRDYSRKSLEQLTEAIEKRKGRLQLAALDQQLNNSGYTGASTVNPAVKRWQPQLGSADEMFLEEREELQARAGDLYRNNTIAHAAVELRGSNAVGQGLRLQSTINRDVLGLESDEADAIEKEIEWKFNLWAKSKECDASRRMNFYQLQQLAFRGSQISGEVFATLPRFDRVPGDIKLRIQLLDALRCQSPSLLNDETHRDGIDFSDRGEPVAYHFTRSDSFLFTDLDTVEVKAFGKKTHRPNVLHIFTPEFIGQSRGVPPVAPIIEILKGIDGYQKAELRAAQVQAFFAAFVERSGEYAQPGMGNVNQQPGQEEKEYYLEPGIIEKMKPGEKLIMVDPTRPNSGFGVYVETMLTLIGMALQIPYEVLVLRFNSSFTASKAARLEAWRLFNLLRNDFKELFCTPVLTEWMYEMVALGRLVLPGFLDDREVAAAYLGADWYGDKQGLLDPVRETNAAILRVGAGLSSIQKEAAEMGTNYEQNVKQTARAKKQAEKEGVQFALFPSPDEKEEEQNEK